jgi:RHS repeat-associated protein
VTYHLNGMVNQVTHASPNGVIDTVAVGTDSMLRPTAIDAKKGAATIWSSGGYSYDGAGNVKQIGAGFFQYDPVSRLLSGTVYDGATGSGTAKTQGYRFDAFGNITRITTNGVQVQTPTAAATNRLTGGTYDAAGNLTAWNGQSYQYDAFNQMTRFCATTPCPGGAGEEWLYMYDANDERIWSFKWGASPRFDRWTLRGLGGEVLREYSNAGYAFTDKKDYIHRDGQLLASVSSLPAEGTCHFHLDHLGTPRAITSTSGALLSYHAYHPFGQEATSPTQDAERMKFTGHERDLANLAGTADDLDSMHARFYSPATGRFLSVDPAMESANPYLPQTWNRYNYVAGNPLKYIDPTGEILRFFGSKTSLGKLKKVANDALHGYDLEIDKDGKASLKPNQEVGPLSPEQQAFADTLTSAINRPATIDLKVRANASGFEGFGQYITGKIDIADIARVGNGAGVTAAAILAHEIREQAVKATLGLANTRADFNIAHAFGVASQGAVAGSLLLSQKVAPNGDVTSTHSQRGRIITVTFQWSNGNLTKISRSSRP